jgi:RNA polymerase primary sigma factor
METGAGKGAGENSMKLSRLTNEQLAAIAAKKQPGGGIAEAILVERNRGLILSTARRYGKSMDLDDAYGVAAYGFIIGVRKFDQARGYRLSTLVAVWMRQALQRAREGTGLIRTPSYMVDLIYQVRKARDIMGRDVTASQIARALKTTTISVQLAMDTIERQSPLSLDMPLSEDGGTLGDIVGKVPSAEDEVLRDAVELDFSSLTPRQLSAIAGVMEGKEMKEVAAQYGVTPQRAQQWKTAAINKLRGQKEAQS